MFIVCFSTLPNKLADGSSHKPQWEIDQERHEEAELRRLRKERIEQEERGRIDSDECSASDETKRREKEVRNKMAAIDQGYLKDQAKAVKAREEKEKERAAGFLKQKVYGKSVANLCSGQLRAGGLDLNSAGASNDSQAQSRIFDKKTSFAKKRERENKRRIGADVSSQESSQEGGRYKPHENRIGGHHGRLHMRVEEEECF